MKEEIKNKIEDLEKRLKNPSVASVKSAVDKLNSMIGELNINLSNIERQEVLDAEEELKKQEVLIKQKEFDEKKLQLENDIEEMQMLIELTQDTVNENPKDEDLALYLELLQDTIQDIKARRDELSKETLHESVFENGGVIVSSDWGNDGSTPSNNKDYNALYDMFPDNHSEAKAIWNQLSQEQKDGFINDLEVTDAASEHIAEAWLEFINAKSEKDWLNNATNWDEMKNGGGVGEKKGKTREEIWNEFSVEQRINFLNENKSFINKEYSKKHKNTKLNIDEWATTIYSDLPDAIKQSLFSYDYFKQYANGGSIPNNYEGKTAEEVWDNWTKEQRQHFIYDHPAAENVDENIDNSDFSYDDLHEGTQFQIRGHVLMGQYSDGGGVGDVKNLVGKFVTVIGFGDVPFYVASDLGSNRYEMINTKTKKSFCIDTDSQEVTEIVKLDRSKKYSNE